MSLWSRLQNAVRPGRLDGELTSEVETHLALLEAEEVKRGASPEEARRRARRRFGNEAVYRERARERDLLGWVESTLRDAAFAARQLRKAPGFTATAVLLLALEIGVNTAIFTLLNSIVLHPLPLEHAERLVVLLEEMPGGGDSPPSWLDQRDFREQNRVFESVGAFSYASTFVLRAGSGETSRVRGGLVTPDYFTTLGVRPVVGRLFTAEEAQAGNDAVALVHEDFWRETLNGDPAVLGREIELNGRRSKIVGVLPRRFRFPWDQVAVWAPLVPAAEQAKDRGWHGFPMVGRLKAGVRLEQAERELSGVMKRLSAAYPEQDRDRTHVLLWPLQRWSVGQTRDRLVVLQGAALAVFLMTCANVGSLLLARHSGRRREFALRAALGASTARQIRQHLTESLLLAGIGCAAGAVVAYGGVQFLLRLYGTSLPREAEIGVDWRLVVYSAGATLAGAVAFGLATALAGRAGGLERALREGGHTAGSRKSARTRKALVAAQVACAVTLVAGAVELVRGFERLTRVESGLDMAHVLTMRVALPDSQYGDGAGISDFFERAVSRVSAVAGVKSAASINLLPIQQSGFNGSLEVPGLPKPPSNYFVELRWVKGDYFRTMGIPLVRGRNFLPEEMGGRRGAAIINETMARTLWGERDPIGWPLETTPDPGRVVGVVRDVRQSGLEQAARPEMYMPLTAESFRQTEQSIVVRSPLGAAALGAAIRREIAGVDGQAAVYQVQPMEEVAAESVRYAKITATLLALFAGLALLLAAFGLHGVMSYVVHERMREFAIRMAIGAQPGQLAGAIFGQSLKMVGVGVALGLGGVWVVTRVLPDVLYGVHAVDARSVGAAVAVLGAAAGVALAAPAWRATHIDAIEMLRED